jgi:PAS domain S-box-containing protein
MINPAYMTRQLFELLQKDFGILGHITSLNPIRPQNAPDPWEKEALKSFEQGRTEYASISMIGGQIYLRHMQPLRTEKSCLTCHATQGYKEGQIRGGISVSIPLAPLQAIEYSNRNRILAMHGLLWGLGCLGLFLGARHLRRSERERRKLEESLASSEEKFRSIFENAGEGIFQSHPDGYFLNVNPAQARMYGYESPEEMIKAVTNIAQQLYVRPEDRERYKKIMEEKGRVENFETLFRQKDGTIRWASLNAHAIRDKEGKISYFEGMVQDITERKEAETRIMKASQEIADLYNTAPCGYHSVGPDGTFINMNDTELEWLGYTREELIGRKKLSDLLAADSQETFREALITLKKEGSIKDIEYNLIRRDGSILPIILNSKAMVDRDGNFLMSRSNLFDMTKLKQAERELQSFNETLEQRVREQTDKMKQAQRVALSMMQDAEMERKRVKEALDKLSESSERLQVLSYAVEQSPSLVMITDRQGQIEYVNPKFEKVTGYSLEEIKGQTPRILKSGVHDQGFYAGLWKTILSGAEWQAEVCNKKKNGELYWEQTFISAIKNESGEILHFISVREDITERRQLNRDMQAHLEELERINRMTINREEKMLQLKEEINALLVKMGQEKKYKIVE